MTSITTLAEEFHYFLSGIDEKLITTFHPINGCFLGPRMVDIYAMFDPKDNRIDTFKSRLNTKNLDLEGAYVIVVTRVHVVMKDGSKCVISYFPASWNESKEDGDVYRITTLKRVNGKGTK